MFIRTIAVFVAVALTALTGCSDQKGANKENFKVAVQNYLDTVYPKCYVFANFPSPIPFTGRSKLRALEYVGLVVETEAMLEPSVLSSDKKKYKGPAFVLTDKGKKYYKSDVSKMQGGEKIGGFCFGKATLKEIIKFSEPFDTSGQYASRVSYTYEVSELPEWTNSSDVLATFYDDLKVDVESKDKPIETSDTFMFKDNVWVHPKLLNK